MTARPASARCRRSQRRPSTGQSLVEISLVIPVMLSLFVGVYAAAGYIADRQVAGQAARAGARLGAEIGSNSGAPASGCQTSVDDPCRIDNQIVYQAKTIGEGLVQNGTIDEIDIYQPCLPGCSATDQQCSGPGVPGDYSPPNLPPRLDRYYRSGTDPVDGTTRFVLQSPPATATYFLSLRQQQHPIEAAIAVRVVYTYRAAVPFFTYFNRQSSEYATMCFSPKFP